MQTVEAALAEAREETRDALAAAEIHADEHRRCRALNAQLLAALKAVIRTQADGHYDERQDALDAAEAVIAKAEGK